MRIRPCSPAAEEFEQDKRELLEEPELEASEVQHSCVHVGMLPRCPLLPGTIGPAPASFLGLSAGGRYTHDTSLSTLPPEFPHLGCSRETLKPC